MESEQQTNPYREKKASMRELGRGFIDVLKYRFNLDEDKANEKEIKDRIRRNIEFRGTNLWTLIFAIFIASIGLNVNSTAVIIGAMLISPLMGPIMGVGLGAGTFNFPLMRHSLKNLFVAVLISIVASAVYFWLTPLKTAQSELLSRTSPTIWDVLIALFGGLAGIVASSRKNMSNTIAGVAIATALMPPLCTAGYGLGTGNFYYFFGAFYLFLINSVFISISTFLIIRFLKFESARLADRKSERKVRRYVTVIAVLTILPSLYLAYVFVQQEVFRQNLRRFMHEVVETNNFYVINEKIRPAQKHVSWLLYGEKPLDSLRGLIAAQQNAYRLEDANFDLRQTLNTSPVKEPENVLQNENTRLLEAQNSILIERDNTIKSLERKLRSQSKQDTLVYREFYALFGEGRGLSIQKTAIWNKNLKKDSVMLIYIKKNGRMNTRQAEEWFRARYGKDSVVVLFDRMP